MGTRRFLGAAGVPGSASVVIVGGLVVEMCAAFAVGCGAEAVAADFFFVAEGLRTEAAFATGFALEMVSGLAARGRIRAAFFTDGFAVTAAAAAEEVFTTGLRAGVFFGFTTGFFAAGAFAGRAGFFTAFFAATARGGLGMGMFFSGVFFGLAGSDFIRLSRLGKFATSVQVGFTVPATRAAATENSLVRRARHCNFLQAGSIEEPNSAGPKTGGQNHFDAAARFVSIRP